MKKFAHRFGKDGQVRVVVEEGVVADVFARRVVVWVAADLRGAGLIYPDVAEGELLKSSTDYELEGLLDAVNTYGRSHSQRGSQRAGRRGGGLTWESELAPLRGLELVRAIE